MDKNNTSTGISRRSLKVLRALAKESRNPTRQYLEVLIESARRKYNDELPAMIQSSNFIKMTKDTPEERERHL